MKKQKKIKEKRTPLKIVTEILALVTVLAFIAAGFRISDYYKGYSYGYDAHDYLYDVEHNRFGRVYNTAISDMARDKTYDANVEELRALGFYFEQAVLEVAYREAGLTREADEFKARKEEYKAELGTMLAKAEEIEDLLMKS